MKCSVCKLAVPRGTGKMFVRNDGQTFNFCSRKCERNWEMKRSDKKIKWMRPEGTKAKPREKKAEPS